MDTFDRLVQMMDEFLNPPQEVPLRVVVTSQPTAGPSTRDPETPRYLTFDEIVNPPQEEPMQTTPEAVVSQGSRRPPEAAVHIRPPQEDPIQGVILTAQTTPEAVVSQGSRLPPEAAVHIRPPQEEPMQGMIVTSQTTPEAVVSQGSRRPPEAAVHIRPPQEDPMQGMIVTSQTTPEAVVSQGSRGPQRVPESAGPTTSRIDLDRRLQELLQRVYGPAGSLEDEQPPVRLFFVKIAVRMSSGANRSDKNKKIIGK